MDAHQGAKKMMPVTLYLKPPNSPWKRSTTLFTRSYSMLPGKDMTGKASLQTGTYNIRHIATGQFVALKDTKRRSTLIALQDSHFEHLAWVLEKLSDLEDTYNIRSFLQNTFARMEQSSKAGAELVSGTESCPWIIRPGFGGIYLISPYLDPSLYWTVVKTRDGTYKSTLTDNPKHHIDWQFSKMSA